MLITTQAPPSLAKCPYHNKARTTEAPKVADTFTPGPIAPDHTWLAKDPVHTPVPQISSWENAKHFDTVIVGGGMGGLNTAWRLKDSGQTIGIFERTKHLGGRVHTAPAEGNSTPMDVGAMRFIPSQHKLLNNLAEHFQIPTKEFIVGGDQNLQFYRGERLTNKQITQDPGAAPYKLAPNEQGKSADDLLASAIEKVIPGFRGLTPEQLELATQNAKLGDVPLTQLGLQNMLSATLSKEAIRFVSDSVGYESDMQNWDAGQAIMELAADYRQGVTYKVPVDGMSAFPRALRADLDKSANVSIARKQTLRQVGYDETSKEFRLIFEGMDGKATPVLADKVVLNLPKLPLSAVVADSPQLQGTPLEQNLDKVKSNPLTRIFLSYDKPWWNEMGIQSGRSMSDLNLGQVYYYGGSQDQKPYIEVYNDGSKSEFWEGLQNPANPGVTTTLSPTPQLAAELQKELQELHGRELPQPTGILYKRWADPFFGAGWHTWNAGSKPWETAASMIQPLQGLPLYLCGEAYSNSQGWIEGALQTSEKVVEHMAVHS